MTTPTTAPEALYTGEERSKRIFAIVGASSGNLVEWFDFYVYAFCAIYFAPAFFPSDNPTVQLVNTAGVFAAGFLMRPIGGWIFGRVADKHGRKNSMLISILMMCFGSLLIACLPTYKDIGVWAPIMLLFARLLQGLSVGGEYGTTATYMSEVALKGQRGFFASFQYVTLIGGQLLAVSLVVILQQFLTEDDLRAYGWRIPFVVGAMAALVSLYLRRSLKETTSKEMRENKDAGSIRALFRDHKAAFITVLGYTAGMHAKTASYIMTGALFLYMCMQPFFGMLADKIGRRNSMLWFGALGTLCTVPILLSLKTVSSPFLAFVLITLALAIVSFYTSISGLVKAEMFPPEVRALGVGLAYAVANAIFGGSAEYVALSLKAVGMENSFYWYVTVMMAIAFLFSLRLPKQAKYLHHDL
jgi:MHS family dicarboxylic acid transporter PcaT-like MFS transporter/MHS family alpha-ketoglutarate permease-like MFS transporter